MIIAFGIRSYKILEKTFTDLHLPEPEEPMSLEARQYYFHLCYIPLFPIKKKWVIRKSDNKLYEPSDLIQYAVMKENIRLGKTVFAFSGLILTALVLAGIMLGSIVRQINYKKQDLEYLKMKYTHLNEKIANPSKLDYYYFNFTSEDSYLLSNQTVFKVVDFDNQSVTFITPDAESLKNFKYYSIMYPVPFFLQDSKTYGNGTVFTVSKADLKQTVNYEFPQEYDFKGAVLSVLDGDVHFHLSDIKTFKDYAPVFYDCSYGSGGSSGEHDWWMRIENQGHPTTVTGLNVIEGDLDWDTSGFPLKVDYNNKFDLFADSLNRRQFHSVVDLICRNEKGTVFTYRITWDFKSEEYDVQIMEIEK